MIHQVRKRKNKYQKLYHLFSFLLWTKVIFWGPPAFNKHLKIFNKRQSSRFTLDSALSTHAFLDIFGYTT